MSAIGDIWNTLATLQMSNKASVSRSEAAQTKACRPSTNAIRVGEFCIDVDTRTATIRGRELGLTPAEFDVLVFLTSHRRRLITAQTRLATRNDDRVRQAEFLPALLSLRKKLQQEVPGVPYINIETWVLFDFRPETAERSAK